MTLEAQAIHRGEPSAPVFGAAILASLLAMQGCGAPEVPPVVFEPEIRAITRAHSRDAVPIVRASGAIETLVVEGSPEGGEDLVLYGSASSGDVYQRSGPVNVEPGEVQSHGEGSPRFLAGRAGKFYAVWLARSPGAGKALRVARSDNFLRSFRDPVTVDTGRGPPPSFFDAELAADGTVIVAWLGLGTGKTLAGTMQLLVSTSADHGDTFDPPVVAASNVCPCCRPSIEADPSGPWYLAWRDTAADHARNIVVATSEDQGATWSRPVPVPGPPWRIEGCPHSGPALLSTGGTLWVAWYTEASGSGRLFGARSTDGARTYSKAIDLAEGVADPNHPTFASSRGRAFVAFQGRGYNESSGLGATRIFVALLDDAPGDPVPLPAGEGSAAYPTIDSLGADKLLVTWTDTSEKGAVALAVRGRLTDLESPR